MIKTLLIHDSDARLATALSEIFAEEDIRILKVDTIDQILETIRKESVSTIVLGDLVPEQTPRITSYNVCYTKLLRDLLHRKVDIFGKRGDDFLSITVLEIMRYHHSQSHDQSDNNKT